MLDTPLLKSNKIKKAYKYIILALSSFFILCFFLLDFDTGKRFIDNLSDFGMSIYTVAFIGIYWLLKKAYTRLKNYHFTVFETIVQLIVAVFFSIASILGKYFEYVYSYGSGEYPLTWIIKVMIPFSLCGGALFFLLALRMIWSISMPMEHSGFLHCFFNRKLYRHCILLISVCWLPQYIIHFPGVFTFDNWHGLAMYMGYEEMTTKHPMIWNVLIGKLTDFGTMIGINWFAIFAICLIHHICAVFLISYTLSTLKNFGAGNKILAVILVFYITLPPMYMYAYTTYNDFLFGLAFLLLTLELVYYLFDRKIYFSEKKHLALTVLALLGSFLRYNGIYAIALTFVVVVIRELFYLIKYKEKFVSLIVITLLFVISMASGLFVQSTLDKTYHAKYIESRAMLAMPIQQSVRCLIEYGDQIPEKEYKAIHAVMTWTDEEYAEKYNPRNFDDVKDSFKLEATKQEIIEFVKAWLQLVKLYPKTCFMATAEQTYFLFCPFEKNPRYYQSTLVCSLLIMERTGLDPYPYVFTVPLLETLCVKVCKFLYDIYHTFPIVGLTVSQGAYTFLLISIFLMLLLGKKRKGIITTIPMCVILGTTFLGPAVYNHPRYTYPIMYCMPVLLFVYMLTKTKGRNLDE